MINSSQLFKKLCNFWGIIDNWCWDGDLVSPMGTHRICWMPQLLNGYRRLTYLEFLVMYSVPRNLPWEIREVSLKFIDWKDRTFEQQEELEERRNRASEYLVMGAAG